MLQFSVREAREFATHYKILEGGEVELIKLEHCETCNSPYIANRDKLKLKKAVVKFLKLTELKDDNISTTCSCTPERKAKTIEEFKNPFDPNKVIEIRKIALECLTDSIALFVKTMCFYHTEDMDTVYKNMVDIADDISAEICAR